MLQYDCAYTDAASMCLATLQSSLARTAWTLVVVEFGGDGGRIAACGAAYIVIHDFDVFILPTAPYEH